MGLFSCLGACGKSLAGTKPAQNCPPMVNCGGVAEKAVGSTRFTMSS